MSLLQIARRGEGSRPDVIPLTRMSNARPRIHFRERDAVSFVEEPNAHDALAPRAKKADNELHDVGRRKWKEKVGARIAEPKARLHGHKKSQPARGRKCIRNRKPNRRNDV